MPNVLTSIEPAGPSVRVRGVRRVFDNRVVALDGVNLDVKPGEFLSIVGPSGCGKSTLLRLIAELDPAQGGEVVIGGAGDFRLAERRSQLAFVFQDAQLLPWRNVLQNVALPLELMHLPVRERTEAAMKAVGEVGLTEAVRRYPNQLSGGMKMRASLARALVTRPKLLLMDEPFAALDEITRQYLDEQLRSLWQALGITILFVTHSIAEAVYLSDRVAVMSQRPGRIVLDRQIDLPTERPAAMRATAQFAAQSRDLFEALRDQMTESMAGSGK